MARPSAPSVEWRHLLAALERLALIIAHHGANGGPGSGQTPRTRPWLLVAVTLQRGRQPITVDGKLSLTPTYSEFGDGAEIHDSFLHRAEYARCT